MQAIHIATANGAAFLGDSEHIGSAKLVKSARNSVGLHWTEDRYWPG
jgi:hypothetical protein